jgi:hypothetical protein
MATQLTLNEAIRLNRLADFIAQAEADGVAAADAAEFEEGLERLIKAPRPAGRTSRSRARGGSRGK